LGAAYALPEYFRLLWKSDFQISTALHEGLGIATLEAMYTDNCCLHPDRCSYPEITSGLPDILYRSPEELLDKLDYFLKSEGARQEVAVELRRQSLHYSPEKVASQLASVFSELAGR
jgi:glycosyltransferase involved in cell wall biosynthesis